MTYEDFQQIRGRVYSFNTIDEVEEALNKVSIYFKPPVYEVKQRVERNYAIYGLAERRCQLLLREYGEALRRVEGDDKKYIVDKYERRYEKAKAFTQGVKAVLGYGMGSEWPVHDRDCGAEQANVSD